MDMRPNVTITSSDTTDANAEKLKATDFDDPKFWREKFISLERLQQQLEQDHVARVRLFHEKESNLREYISTLENRQATNDERYKHLYVLLVQMQKITGMSINSKGNGEQGFECHVRSLADESQFVKFDLVIETEEQWKYIPIFTSVNLPPHLQSSCIFPSHLAQELIAEIYLRLHQRARTGCT